jgi:chaperonin GroES
MKEQPQKIHPLGENVLVKPEKEMAKTKSGLVLPETATPDRPQEGKVIAVGDSDKIKVKKGQTIIFAKYAGSEIKIGEEEYLIIKNEEILAVIG